MTENDGPRPADDVDVGLGRLERIGAALLGLAGVGTGGVGVFLSENQAGTTAILLIGAVFLLMTVQGTPIVSASKEKVELARKRANRAVATSALGRATDLVADEPVVAAELVAVAHEIDPEIEGSRDYQDIREKLYPLEVDRSLRGALTELLGGGIISSYAVDADYFCSEVDLHSISEPVVRRADRLITVEDDGKQLRIPVAIKNVRSIILSSETLEASVLDMVGISSLGLVVHNGFSPERGLGDVTRRLNDLGFDVLRYRDSRDDRSLLDHLKSAVRKGLQ